MREILFVLIRLLKNKYHANKYRFDHLKHTLEFSTFIITILIIVQEIYRWTNKEGHLFYFEEKYFDYIKIITEVVIVTFILSIGFFRTIIGWIFDPMQRFYKSLMVLKKANTTLRPEATGFKINKYVSEENIKCIFELAVKTWGIETFSAPYLQSRYQSWHKANPNVFSLILQDSEPIGYICVLPLINDMHFNHEESRYGIEPGQLANSAKEASYILIESIVLRYEYQKDLSLAAAIFYEVLRKIKLFASEVVCKVYAAVYYKSIKKFLEANGFAIYNRKHGTTTRYIPMLNCGPIEVDIHEQGARKKWDTNKASYFFQSLKDVALQHDQRSQAKEKYKIFETLAFVSEVKQFVQDSFADIISDRKIVDNFAGKTFAFYTHATYKIKSDGQSQKQHFLGTSYIQFDTLKHKHFLGCKFYTGSRASFNSYLYSGVCFFSRKDKGDILMIFHPEKYLGIDSETWEDHKNVMGDAPAVISGRILVPGGAVDIASRFDHDKLVSLNLTTFSQNSRNTVSKIGLLHMLDVGEEIPRPKSLFSAIEPIEGEDDIIRTIKLYLMRSSKVQIKGPDKKTINKIEDIQTWMKNNYSLLANFLDSNFELFYYKRGNSPSRISGMYINFLPNGVARLIRYNEQLKKNEQYYGEVNVRYNAAHNRFIYIKFIEIEPRTMLDIKGEELHQEYREIFLILFWPSGADRQFDYTRGILLGDKDSSDSHDALITSNVCALCKTTNLWREKIDVDTGKDKISPALPFSSGKLERVHTFFLRKVLIQQKAEMNKRLKPDVNQSLLEVLLNTLELEYDLNKCSYNEIFQD